jgi:hypothetical protein
MSDISIPMFPDLTCRVIDLFSELAINNKFPSSIKLKNRHQKNMPRVGQFLGKMTMCIIFHCVESTQTLNSTVHEICNAQPHLTLYIMKCKFQNDKTICINSQHQPFIKLSIVYINIIKIV